MSKIQIMLAIVLVLTIVALFLPWLNATTVVGGERVATINRGYDYIVPLAPYTAPVAVLCVIGLVLSAYSFKAETKVRKLNVIAGVLIIVGVIAAFAYTTAAAMGAARGGLGGSINVSGSYGMGLTILFGFLMIIFGALAKPRPSWEQHDR